MIEIQRLKLEYSNAEAIVFGAKDTGEMGGGAATSIVVNCGTEILSAIKAILPGNSKIGDVFVTDSFNLKKTTNIKYVFHFISIKKNTPQGAYCPEPQNIYDGVLLALEKAKRIDLNSIAFSAMGTGEGRVSPEDCSKYMLNAAFEFQKEDPKMKIMFCLPNYREYKEFLEYYGRKISKNA